MSRFIMRERLPYGCKYGIFDLNACKKLNSCCKVILRKMIRSGFDRKDQNNDYFRCKISYNRFHKICRSTNLSEQIAHQNLS